MQRRGSVLISAGFLIAVSALSAVSFATDSGPTRRVEAPPAPPPAPATVADAASLGTRKARPRQYQLAVDEEHLVLITDRNEEVLRFPARLDVRAKNKNQSLSGRWEQRGSHRAVGRASNRLVDVEFEVSADPTTAFIDANVKVTYKQKAFVTHEVWTLPLVDVKGRVLDRAYQWHDVGDKALVVDQWTPLIGQFHAEGGPAFGLVGDDTFQAARVQQHALHLELDHWANHPHTVYSECHATYAPHRPELGQSQRLRDSGEVIEGHVRLVAGRGRMPVLRRWPDDRQAAFSFVDHADNGRASTLRALLHGSSAAEPGAAVTTTASGDEVRGLLGHGLVLTRTAFDHKHQLGDEAFDALLTELQRRGGEVAPHSITPWRESKQTVAASLEGAFKPYAPVSWVDHQPDTNCEAINNLGGRRGHRSNTVQTLLDHGIRYIWEAPDPDYDGNLNLLMPHRKLVRAPFFYRAPRIGRGEQTTDPWLFTTAWMFLPVDDFVSRLTDERLDQLQADHGIHLGHTYLGAVHRSAEHQANTLFVRDKDGALVTRPSVEQAWARLAERHKKGDLWVTTVRDVGDWLATWDDVRLDAVSPTRVRLVHRKATTEGDRRVRQGFTIAARYKGRVNGARRVTLDLDEEAHVWPPVFEDDLGVTIIPGAARTPRTALGRGYAWPHGTSSLFSVARDLDAPGVHIDEACTYALPGGDCARGALEPFYERLDGLVGVGDAEALRTRILVFGNSLIASDRVTDIVRQRLQSRFGEGGRGIVYVDALKFFGRRTWTGRASDGWYAEYLTQYMGERPPAAYPLGVTGGHFVAFKEGASTTWSTGGARQAELYWLDHERAPPFTLSVDGRPLLRVKPKRTGKAALTAIDLPRGARQLTFTTEGARAVVYGATLEQPTPGIVLDTIGIVAASANSYLKADEAVFADQLKMRDPSLIVFMLGGNEARRIDRGVFTKQQVHDDFIAFVERTRAAAPNAACLTVGPIETVFVHTPRHKPFETRPYVDYVVQTERRLSLELGCGFIDLFAAMGGQGSLTKFDRRGYLHSDRIHPRGDGLDMLGELVADALLRGYAASRDDRRDALASLFGEHDALLNPTDPAYVIDPGDEAPPPEGARRPVGERSSP